MKLRLLSRGIKGALTTAALAVAMVVLAAASASAQIFTENFSYTAATTLVPQGGWAAHSGAGTNSETIQTPGLTYPGYPGTGVGNKVSLAASGEDDNHTFTGVTTGSVYASVLVNISAATTGGDYMFHFFDGAVASNLFRARLFVKRDATVNVAFGVQSSSGAGSLVYTPFSYALNTTYLVVIKYTFVAGATNDQVSLFVNPVLGGAEPAPNVTTTTVAAEVDATTIDAIAIRQGSAATGPAGSVDAIRVGNTWASTTSWQIAATTTGNGTITPSGTTSVIDGGSQAYTIAADANNHIVDVKVDGVSQGPITSFSFTNVTANHTIDATFALDTNPITATAGAGGSIAPPGTTNVNYGSNQSYTITPNAGFVIADVKVDGVSQGAINSFTFTNVIAPHTIDATFIATYTLTATAGPNGSIAPPGVTTVNSGGSQAYTITADPNYHIDDVKVDGVSQGAIGSYTFTNVTANHTIDATFAIDTYTITASSGANGTVAPPGVTTVPFNGSQAYTITPDAGYHVADVLVDAVSVGPVTNYTFNNVGANHTISATFAINTYNIVATAGPNGSIAPPGTTAVNFGGSQAYTITPAGGYTVTDVKVDGVSQGSITSYTFTNVQADHTIDAQFGNSPVVDLETSNGYSTIQAALDDPATLDGHHITVAAGVYQEQVEVIKNVTIHGSGCGVTIIKSPATLTKSFITPGPNTNKPVVFVHDGGNGAHIENLTIDGDGQGNANARFIGAAFWNAGGFLTDACVINVEDTPFDGAQHGVGVYANNSTGGPYSVDVGNVKVSTFQKNAFVLNGTGLTVNVHGTTVTGAGYTSVTAQNGIQVSFGAGGSISNSTITDIGYTPATFVASGILTDAGTSVAASSIEITNVQAPVTWYDTDGSMTSIHPVGGSDFGPIFIYNSSTTPGPAKVTVNGKLTLAASQHPAKTMASHPKAQPFDAIAGAAAYRGNRALSSFTVSVGSSCLNGTDVSGSVGIFAYSEGGPLAVSAGNNEVANWDAGLAAYGGATTLTANLNSVTSNVSAGYDNLSGVAQDATNNWWGSATGPSGDGPGTGDAVIGGNVNFTPWLHSGDDTNTGCGFAPNAYTITATAGPNGSIAPSGSVTVFQGQDQSFTITANAGYRIGDVKVDGVSVGTPASYTFTNVTTNHTIDAQFVLDVYDIVATAGPGGTIAPPGTTSVPSGGSQSYTITPNAGFTILDVKVDGVSQGPIASYTFTNVLMNHTIDATFSQTTYTLTVTVIGNGTVAKAPDQPSYNSGSTVVLTANPAAGWHLDSWSGDASGHASPLNVLMDADKNITATFLPDIYTWNKTGTASYGVSTNWTPERHTPNTDDVLQFSAGGSVVVTDVPTETIGELLLSNNSSANLQSNAAVTLTLSGGAGTDLSVPSGSTLSLSAALSTNSINIALAAMATGTVGGTVNLSGTGTPHKLTALGAGALHFLTASQFVVGTGISGNPFGIGTGTSNVNSVVFETGSLLAQTSGSTPFGATAPATVISFQTHSRFRLDGPVTPQFSGRTYADYEQNTAGPTTTSGSLAFSVDDIIVTTGSFTLAGTGNGSLRGNITVQPGTSLGFLPASGSPVYSLNGPAAQTIDNKGTISSSVNLTVEVNNSNGVTLADGDLTLNSIVKFTSGNITTTATNALAMQMFGQVIGASQGTGYVVGNVLRTIPTGNNTRAFDVGDASFYTPVSASFNGVGTSFTVTGSTHTPDEPNIATSGLTATKTANRYWTLTPSVASPIFLDFDAVFNFVASDVDGGANTSNFVTMRYNGTWFSTFTGTRTATSTQAIGVTGFGDFQCGELEPATAVLLNLFETETVNDGIELRWQFGDATEVTATSVERSATVVGPWKKIDAQPTTVNNITTVIDRTVEADKSYVYRLVATVKGGQTVSFTPVEGKAGELITEFALARVSPNPTTDVARIEYTVPREAKVRVSILDLQGRLVSKVVDLVQRPGRYQAIWSGSGDRGRVAAGMYFVRFEGGGKVAVKRIALTR